MAPAVPVAAQNGILADSLSLLEVLGPAARRPCWAGLRDIPGGTECKMGWGCWEGQWRFQALVRHPPLPPLGGYLKLSAGVRWEEEEGSQVWNKGPSPVDPSTLLLGGTFPECTPLPSSLHHFLHLSSTPLILKTAKPCSFPPPLHLRDAKFLELVCPFHEGSVVLL